MSGFATCRLSKIIFIVVNEKKCNTICINGFSTIESMSHVMLVHLYPFGNLYPLFLKTGYLGISSHHVAVLNCNILEKLQFETDIL